MKQTFSRLALGASLAVAGCQTQQPLPEPQSLSEEDQILSVRFREPRDMESLYSMDSTHRHLFPMELVKDTATYRIVHKNVSLSRKLVELVVRRRFLKGVLHELRHVLDDETELEYELELRMIPYEMKRLERALERELTTDEV